MHPTTRPTTSIACDESGFVGGSLFGEARIFTHASVTLGVGEAEELLSDVRRRLGGTDGELKASRLNRRWARPVADWLLAPDGPLDERVAVHVTDTRLFGLARIAQVVTGLRPEGWWGADAHPDAWAWAHRLSGRLAAWDRERELLDAGRDLLWLRRHRRMDEPLESWLRLARAAADADPEMRGLATRAAEQAVRDYVADPPVCPLNEPLLPAVWCALLHGSESGDPEIVHDEQSVLTPARIDAMATELSRIHPGRRLAGFRRVDSRDDARVQVADLVAGVVRRTLEEGDPTGRRDLSHLVTADSVLSAGAARGGHGPRRDPSPGPSATC